MAAKTFSTYISELSEVASLGAGDRIPVLESSETKYVDGGDIGGETIVTGTITGTAETPVTLYEGVGTDAHLFLIKLLFKCTNAGNGTTVVDEGTMTYSFVSVRSGGVATWNDLAQDIDDASMSDFNWNIEINSGNLIFKITPPSTTGSTTEFSYKVSFSRLAL